MEQKNRLTTELSASSHRSERHVGFELLRIVGRQHLLLYLLAAVCARQGIDKLLCYADGVLYGHFEH